MHDRKALISRMLLIVLAVLSCTAANATPVLLANVPDYAWTDGCSPTSATMLMGYYAINGAEWSFLFQPYAGRCSFA